MSAFQHIVWVCHSVPPKKQSPSDFMTAVTICNDFRAEEEEISQCFHLFPFYLLWSNGAGCHDLVFFNISFKSTLSVSSFTLIKRLFSSSSLSAIRVVSSAYLRLLMFLLPWFHPDNAPSAFLMMCSAYRLNKQGDSRQPCSILSQSWTTRFIQGSNCCFLTYIQISQETGRMVWYSHLFKSFP